MGKLAQSSLKNGGKVVGVYPKIFSKKQEGLTELILTEDIHTRKRIMMERSDACIALPGGIGTFDELFEAITWNKLKLNPKPVIIVNTLGYYDPIIEMLEKTIKMKFLDKIYWTVVSSGKELLSHLKELNESLKE